jgi:hypothetical protein
VCRSTLADANQVRDWRIYADLAAVLIKRARRLYSGQQMDVELQQSVYALDSTTIDLEPFSVGTFSLNQSRDQTAYSTRPAWTDSFLYRNHRWALPRRQHAGCADGRAGSLLCHERSRCAEFRRDEHQQ